MERAAGVQLQVPEVRHRVHRAEDHQSPGAEVHRSRDVLRSLAGLRVHPDHRVLRPWACVLDAWGAVRLGTGRVPKGRRVAGIRRQVLPADDGQRSACHAVCLLQLQMFRSELPLREPVPEPCTRALGRSAASPCGVQEVPAARLALALLPGRLLARVPPQQRQELGERQVPRAQSVLHLERPAQQRRGFQQALLAVVLEQPELPAMGPPRLAEPQPETWQSAFQPREVLLSLERRAA
jgi:hypothetical protein